VGVLMLRLHLVSSPYTYIIILSSLGVSLGCKLKNLLLNNMRHLEEHLKKLVGVKNQDKIYVNACCKIEYLSLSLSLSLFDNKNKGI
jgi:hypothetical protein